MTNDPGSPVPTASDDRPTHAERAVSGDEFAAELRAIGERRYHHRHPFNVRMHEGRLSRRSIQLWVANRYYYQSRIPIKDGLILTKSPEAAFRREWVQRIHDHDGRRSGEGGLELWLQLAAAVGLSRTRVEQLEDVLPGVRRACDAYVDFVSGHDLLESVAASLTELFAGSIMASRIQAFEKHYGWVGAEGLAYFESRIEQAPRDSRYGLAYVIDHAHSRAEQDRCLAALRRKCEILWQLLDAVELAASRLRIASHALERDEPDGRSMLVLSERALRLGGSSREILDLCDGTRTGSEIAECMRERHPGEARVFDDVHDFLQELALAGALQLEPELP